MGDHDELRQQALARVGVTLKDKWRLDKLLGLGGMASVYAATHHNQKRVAVKILHRELSSHPDVRARFLREGYLANTVGHSGVVTVDDDNVLEDGSAFLVMELLQGETLEARRTARGGTLPVDEVLAHTARLLDVLVAAHDKGVVHRDLKPDNLFLTTAGELKVLDFGIARLQEMSASSGGTRIGSIMGTPTFMAPEQARARWDEVDGRTDLFAVGATMYTLLSGRYVHEAGTINEELGLAMTARATSLANVAPGLPAKVVAFVDRALAYEKAARWSDARAMRGALAEVRVAPVPTLEGARERPPTTLEGARERSASNLEGARERPLEDAGEHPPTIPLGPAPPEEAGPSSVAPAPRRFRRAPIIAGAAVICAALAILALRPVHPPPGPAGGSAQPAVAQVTDPAPALPARTAGTPATVDVAPAVAPSADTATPTVNARALATGSEDSTPPRKDGLRPAPTTAPKAPPAPAVKPQGPPTAATANPFDRRH